MNFLVTGGAGFIGSHIVKALLARGDSVRVLDNFSTGKKENIPAGVEVVNASITEASSITRAFEGIYGVFHCAALPRVQESIDYPRESHEVNINGTLNVILAARNAGVQRIVYCASSAAYGDQKHLPLHEGLLPNPKSPYALQKYVGEHYLRLASVLWGLKTISLRYFNVYGPGMAFEGAYSTVIGIFLKQRSNGLPLTITGTGTQTRDFVFVDDVARANLLAMDHVELGDGEVINIGVGARCSVNDIAAMIGGRVTHIEPRIEPHDSLADIRRAQELLGWLPEVSFEQGLRRTVEWFKQSVKHF